MELLLYSHWTRGQICVQAAGLAQVGIIAVNANLLASLVGPTNNGAKNI